MKPKWKKHEEKIAKEFNGVVSKGSGNYWGQPSDVKNKNFLIEAKQTEKKSYSISKQTWDKIYEEALFSYRYPMIILKIQDIELVVMGKEDFMKLFGFKLDK